MAAIRDDSSDEEPLNFASYDEDTNDAKVCRLFCKTPIRILYVNIDMTGKKSKKSYLVKFKSWNGCNGTGCSQ